MTSPIEEDGRHGNPLTMTKCGCRVAGSQGADLDDTPENHGLWICLWLPGVVTERSRQINGPIADRAGAVVPNVAVEIRNAETGAVYQAGRRRRGNYSAGATARRAIRTLGERAGLQEVRSAKCRGRGRADLSRRCRARIGIEHRIGHGKRIAPLLKTESGKLSHTVTTNTMNNLPCHGGSARPPARPNCAIRTPSSSCFPAVRMPRCRYPDQWHPRIPSRCESKARTPPTEGTPRNRKLTGASRQLIGLLALCEQTKQKQRLIRVLALWLSGPSR